jgi:Rab GTPase-activating protein 1
MPEERAFCVLVRIMFDYGMRELFKTGFDALHLRFYQLQRLVKVETRIQKLIRFLI